MRLTLCFSVLMIAALFACIPCFSQTPVVLRESSLINRVDTHVAFFVDSTESLSIDDILTSEIQERFRPQQGNLTFGYLKPPIWLKLQARATSPNAQWYMEIPAPFLEYVDFYQNREDDQWDHTLSGYFRKHSERRFSHTSHVLPLQFGEDSLSTVYIKIAGVSPKTFPLYVIEKGSFIQKTRVEDLGYGVFFGILFVMFLYNCFIYVNLRQKNYFLYICIIGSTFLIFAAVSGYGGKFLWPEKPFLNFVMGKLALEVLILFMTLYTINFLEVKKYSRIMYLALRALIPLSVIALLLAASQVLYSVGNSLIAVASLIYLVSGVVVSANGNKTARYFIAAWSVYFFGGLLLTLRNGGILDYNFWTTHFVETGAVLGTAIIGLALGAQYRRFEAEKEEAQKLALEIQREATTKMEARVIERTSELCKTNKELEHTLETNRKQTEIIKNKNTELDTFFYRISHDLKGPISSSLALMLLAKVDVKEKVALEYIDRQYIQLERLSQIITGLVNLTRLNNANLVREPINFQKMIDDCIRSFDTFENFSRVRFEEEIQPNLTFHSEWALLNTIVQNLIENAIKYAQDHSPYIKIKVSEEPEWLVIRVEDNGIGIHPAHHKKIFEMFYRATHTSFGSGLGLYILKRSLDRLKGTITIESEVDRGSTFTVRLPRSH